MLFSLLQIITYLKLTKVPEEHFNLTVGEIYSFDNQNKLGVLIYDT